jgi:hypothetical protein
VLSTSFARKIVAVDVERLVACDHYMAKADLAQ